MINFQQILKQAWRIVWSYRTLWIFGLLLALTGGGSGVRLQYNLNDNRPRTTQPVTGADPAWLQNFNRWAQEYVFPVFTHPEQHIATLAWLAAGLFMLFLVFGLLASLVRYPVETAVMRMVDEYNQSGTKAGLRAGWRLGWNRRALRLWAIDLIFGLPAFIIVLVSLGAGLAAFFNFSAGARGAAIFGGLALLCVFFFVLVIIIAAALLLSLLRNFFSRATALDELGVLDALRSGWALFRKQWKNASLMWLVMVGVGLLFSLVEMVALVVLIPAYLVLLVPALLAGLLPGALAFGVASLFTGTPLTWIIGGIAALPLFLIILFSPLIFLRGLYTVFESSAWTLTYRELKAMENSTPM